MTPLRFWLSVGAGFAAGYGVARMLDQRAKQAALASQARAAEAGGAITVTPAPRALPPPAPAPTYPYEPPADPDSSPPIIGLEEVGLDEFN